MTRWRQLEARARLTGQVTCRELDEGLLCQHEQHADLWVVRPSRCRIFETMPFTPARRVHRREATRLKHGWQGCSYITSWFESQFWDTDSLFASTQIETQMAVAPIIIPQETRFRPGSHRAGPRCRIVY